MNMREFKLEIRKVLVCMAAAAVLVLLCMAVSSRYRILTPYYAPEDVTELFAASSNCLGEQLGQFKEIQHILDAAAGDDLFRYASMHEYYTDCLKTDQYYMDYMMKQMANLIMKMTSEGEVFKGSGRTIDRELCNVFAQRSYERSCVYDPYLQTLYRIMCDEELRERHARTYIDLMSDVIKADGEVSVSLYQMLIRQIFSMRQLQYGEYAQEDSAFDCLTEEQKKELFCLAENNLKELYLPRVHALWKAEYELETYVKCMEAHE